MLRSPLFPIFLTVLVDVMALTLVVPLLPYYGQHFGASPFVVTCLMASFAACQLISGPILGQISDRVGRKPTLLVSQMGTFIGFLVLGGARSLWMLFLGRIIDGLTAGNLSVAQAYISDVTTPENRTRAFGLIGIAFGMGFLLGPAASGFLGHRFGYAAPAFLAAGLSFTSIIVTQVLLPESPRPTGRSPGRLASFRLLGRPETRAALLRFFVYMMSFATLIGGIALFLKERFSYNVEQTSYVYAYSGLVGGLIQGGIGRLAKRLGEPRLALGGFVLMAIGSGFLALAFNLPVLLLVTTISSAGSAVLRPSLTTLITKSVAQSESGAVLGVSQSLASSAQIVGPLIAGFLIEHGYLGAFGLTVAAFAALGALLFLVHKEPAPAES